MFDGKAFGAEIVGMVRDYVEQATTPLLNRIGALEKELSERPQPHDGKDADPAVIERLVAEAIAAIPSPKDGTSVDPEAVRAMVDEAVSALPAPKDGADADPALIERLVADAVAAIPAPKDGESVDPVSVKAMIEEAVAALPVPKDGDSFTAEDAAPVIAEAVAKAVAALPPAEPGRDADPEVVRQMVEEAVAAMPVSRDGKDADQAAIVLDVVAALEPIVAEQVAGLEIDETKIAELVDEAVAKIPAPKDGKSITAEDVAPLIAESVERAVAALAPPKDGIGLAGALIDRSGNLVVTLTDGSQRELGPVIGKDGEPGKDAEPGKDGADGLGFEDLDLTFDGERKLVATFTRGEVSKAVEIEFPIIIDRGVYKAGETYVRGDAVTWGGSLWIAREDTADKPETSEAWRLAVKRGRDGKAGDAGRDGKPGEKGDPGRDGRSF